MNTNANPDLTIKLPKQLQDQIRAAQEFRDQQASPPAATEPPVGTPEPGAPESAPAAAPVADEEQSWEQRYNSLKGRLDQERRDKQAVIERMNDLESLVETMRAAGTGTMKETPAPQYQKLLTEQEEADYGEEMLNVVAKKAREELVPEVDTLKREIEQLKGRLDGVGNVMAKSEQQKMYDGLNNQVPAWQQINVNQQFKDWLSMSDPYSGRRRHDMLIEAFNRHDTQRVVQFFKGFAEVTGTPLGTTSPGNEAPPLNNGSGRPSLADFAAPGRARSGQDTVSPDKPIYTNAQIARFYADRRTGKWKGREADADLIERDIFQAQHEGRIQ